jgi:Rps23 Pro-64 3,4-dihydroxylase Tpa1-like proline 4-hydroxylase
LDVINPTVHSKVREYEQQFRTAAPFPHVVIDDFLTPAFAEQLLRDFPAFDAQRAKNELGKAGLKAVQEKLAGVSPVYAQLDGIFQSDDFRTLVGGLTGIPALLYDADYFGGGTHENLHGQELDAHVDFNVLPERQWHRRLNAIIYLNKDWQADWGGALELHSDPWSPDKNTVKSVVPLFNRCVIFETSERSWHAFNRIVLPSDEQQRSRKSVALYYYTADRPADEIAPAHSTFYVHRPLPEHIVAGHTLSESDYEEIRSLLHRRDGWIRYLYKREMELAKEIDDLGGRGSVAATVLRRLYFDFKHRIYNGVQRSAPNLLATMQRKVAPALKTVETRLKRMS